MNYRESLSPWVLYRILPNCQRIMMDRFRRRNHAEECVKVLKRLFPAAEFEVVFEVDRSLLSSPKQPSLLEQPASPEQPLRTCYDRIE